ncbi:hypothetical protein HHI36_021827 [Cryptolaemus montrouzieri]|uniref:Glucose-methanol-choline oxidoreductase N-terminal domain-containing protein n=1 Tax=Cryptolaemus montrouzieri TaxID=559131 RepID=A0ABD2MZA4_9CUCU
MGKALGGSTAINGMLWARGNPKDYNLWAQQGNEGWSYEELLPYFKKSEDSNIKHYSSHHQGKGGKVHLENSHFESHATEYILRAAKELKIPYVNYNAGDQMGIGHAQGALKDGKRWSSARAYLEPAEKKSNLIIKSKSTVLKVLIDENKVAYGVQYIQNGTLYEAHTRKEVILSAGGMATPKLLMLSGIGIKFIFDKSPLSPENRKEEIVEYLKHGKGPLTAFSADLVAYFKTKVSQDEDGYPDIELTFSPKRSNDRLAVAVNVVLMHPKSTGTIKLLSKDPLDPPLIDPSYLSDENDMNTVLAGIRIAQTFTKTDVFKTYGGHLDSEPLPACSFEKFDSDSYWRCAVQHQSICLSDPAGTAKMGGENDTDAVVDSKLKVHGIKHLRVVDNSVIPISVTGHMMAPAYMIGEKAADIIKYFWKSK